MWTITVHGLPAPKGSLKAIPGGRGGRAILIEDDKTGALKPWRAKLTAAGHKIRAAAGGTLTGPVAIDLCFWLPRPKSVRRALPSVRPDVDKLTRAVLDALTDADAWKDDGQVVELTASKAYADQHQPGVTITLTPITEPETPT